jgi:inorganic triphosphatase YgiF
MVETTDAPAEGVEEREVKLAVADDFVLPPLSDLDGLVAVDAGEQLLRAVYWDTDDLELARAGVGVRHRNGIWAFKGRSRREGDAVVREELEVAGDAGSIPSPVRARVEHWVDPGAVHPVAQLDTLRRTIDVTDGSARAELVHDRVSVVDGTRVVARFTEVEVEFNADSSALAERLVTLLKAHGAVVDTRSKYVRALGFLGHDPPDLTV